jgi:hypothetical protein
LPIAATSVANPVQILFPAKILKNIHNYTLQLSDSPTCRPRALLTYSVWQLAQVQRAPQKERKPLTLDLLLVIYGTLHNVDRRRTRYTLDTRTWKGKGWQRQAGLRQRHGYNGGSLGITHDMIYSGSMRWETAVLPLKTHSIRTF